MQISMAKQCQNNNKGHFTDDDLHQYFSRQFCQRSRAILVKKIGRFRIPSMRQ